MKKIFSAFLLSISIFWQIGFALENHVEGIDWIDVTVSPTRYELSGDPGTSMTKSIKVINNSQFPVTFASSVENCRAKDTTGTPDCSNTNDYVNLNSQISSWISLSETSFSIPARSEKDINFTVDVPSEATPGTHFGAIFFSTGKKQGTIITTEKRIGVLILYNVSGDVVTNGVVNDVSIAVRSDGGGWGNPGNKLSSDIISKLKKTVFTMKTELASGVDDIVSNLTTPEAEKVKNETTLKEKQRNEKIQVDFNVSFVNSGNTYIKPQGKIVILENGKPLTKISKELIKNSNDAVVGEKVVDYIPINDEGGNVLPSSTRDFNQQWNGFPYEIINDKGEREVKYKTFSEYFSEQNMSKRQVLMFWEQVKTREKTKGLKAQIQIAYKGQDEKDEEYNSAKDFSVSYTEQYIGYNWFILLILGIFGIILFWIILAAKKRNKKENDEIRKLKKRLKEQEKELDKIEDMVEDIPQKVVRRREKVEEKK